MLSLYFSTLLKKIWFTLAEGMLLKKPVISINYSQDTEFVNNPQNTNKIANAGKQQILEKHPPVVAVQRYYDRLLQA
ncbi:MAG: hypothetical protein QNJ32_11495 [Xenococcaceae cyanobacterium MO_167.B27]|nr:hypothetical protein [Xenococcaceae cyanobacterium MO_167.B27]